MTLAAAFLVLAMPLAFSKATDAFLSNGPSFISRPHKRSSERCSATIDVVETKPIPGMKPGTSGLRKKVEVWQATDPSNKNYLQNFIQALIDTAIAKNGGTPPNT